MNNTTTTIVAALLSSGCLGVQADTDPFPAAPSVQPGMAAPVPIHAAHRVQADDCRVVLTPEPEVADSARYVAQQWSDAGVCDITVGTGGVPVYLADRPTGIYGEPVPTSHKWQGATGYKQGNHPGEWDIHFVQLVSDLRLPSQQSPVLMHEVGHVLGIGTQQGKPSHTEDGTLMAHDGAGYELDQSAIDAACELLVCP